MENLISENLKDLNRINKLLMSDLNWRRRQSSHVAVNQSCSGFLLGGGRGYPSLAESGNDQFLQGGNQNSVYERKLNYKSEIGNKHINPLK